MENIDFNSIEFVVIIQCAIAKKRCSGYYCMQAFYDRVGRCDKYPKDKNIKYMSIECGGCCGKLISSYLGHFHRKMIETYKIQKDNTVIQFASCVTNDNHHYDRCPHYDYMKDIVTRKFGYKNIVEGTYINKITQKLREARVYHTYLNE